MSSCAYGSNWVSIVVKSWQFGMIVSFLYLIYKE
jgi:hypothetical protein